MSKAYRKMADQLFSEKVRKEFPDWSVNDSNISTGKVTISNEGSVFSLLYDSNANIFQIESITIKATHVIIATQDELKGIYAVMTRGDKI